VGIRWADGRRNADTGGCVAEPTAAVSQEHRSRGARRSYTRPTVPLVALIPADQAPLLTASFYAAGDPGPITATLAHVPELVAPALAFLGPVLGASSIDFRTKEIVILRTSVLLGCRYCIDTHTPIAAASGLSVEEVRALRNEPGFDVDAHFLASGERLLIDWIDAVATGRGAVPTAVGERVQAHYADAEIVELTLLVGATMLLNRYASALQLPVGADAIARLSAAGFERTP
jgi:AhpD family alkylhydroperoxidase